MASVSVRSLTWQLDRAPITSPKQDERHDRESANDAPGFNCRLDLA